MRPVRVRPTVLVPCEAWQVEPGNDGLRAAAEWARTPGDQTGIWGEDAPDQMVWIDGVRPARVWDWIVKTPAGVLVLSAEQFADAFEVVPTEVTQ